jgi:hypothetical protein
MIRVGTKADCWGANTPHHILPGVGGRNIKKGDKPVSFTEFVLLVLED